MWFWQWRNMIRASILANVRQYTGKYDCGSPFYFHWSLLVSYVSFNNKNRRMWFWQRRNISRASILANWASKISSANSRSLLWVSFVGLFCGFPLWVSFGGLCLWVSFVGLFWLKVVSFVGLFWFMYVYIIWASILEKWTSTISSANSRSLLGVSFVSLFCGLFWGSLLWVSFDWRSSRLWVSFGSCTCTSFGRVYWQIEQARSPPPIFCGSLL